MHEKRRVADDLDFVLLHVVAPVDDDAQLRPCRAELCRALPCRAKPSLVGVTTGMTSTPVNPL